MGWPNCVNTYAPPALFLYFITHVCVPCTALGLLGLLELHLRHCGLARLHDLPGAPPSWEGKGEPALPISLSLSRARALFLSHACCPRAQQPPLSGTQASPPRRRRSLPACPTCCSRAACPHFKRFSTRQPSLVAKLRRNSTPLGGRRKPLSQHLFLQFLCGCVRGSVRGEKGKRGRWWKRTCCRWNPTTTSSLRSPSSPRRSALPAASAEAVSWCQCW